MAEERKLFIFDDDRKASIPPGERPAKRPHTETTEDQQEPPDTPVGPSDPVSMAEVMKKVLRRRSAFILLWKYAQVLYGYPIGH